MSQTSAGCYTISLPGGDLADNLQRTLRGEGGQGANSPSNKLAAPGAAFLHFSASLHPPNPPQPLLLATGGEEDRKAHSSPALGYLCSSQHSSVPLPFSPAQLLLPLRSHEKTTLMVDASRSWCRGGMGSAASAPAQRKPWCSSVALPCLPRSPATRQRKHSREQSPERCRATARISWSRDCAR